MLPIARELSRKNYTCICLLDRHMQHLLSLVSDFLLDYWRGAYLYLEPW
jgi:hypothetical protein